MRGLPSPEERDRLIEAVGDVGAGHAGVDGIAPQETAENTVVGVGLQAADHIAGIDIFYGDFCVFGVKMGGNGLFQIQADVLEFDIAGGIPFGFFIIEKFLTGTLGRNDNRMPPARQSLLERTQ